MSRQEFLSRLGLSSRALLAVYCIGNLAGCSREADPSPDNSGDFTLDLDSPANVALRTNGGFLVQGDVIVARTNTGNFVALSRACTHEGTEVVFEPVSNSFICPLHYSVYRVDGTVTEGPAPRPLRRYNTQFDATANRLRVFT